MHRRLRLMECACRSGNTAARCSDAAPLATARARRWLHAARRVPTTCQSLRESFEIRMGSGSRGSPGAGGAATVLSPGRRRSGSAPRSIRRKDSWTPSAPTTESRPCVSNRGAGPHSGFHNAKDIESTSHSAVGAQPERVGDYAATGDTRNTTYARLFRFAARNQSLPVLSCRSTAAPSRSSGPHRLVASESGLGPRGRGKRIPRIPWR